MKIRGAFVVAALVLGTSVPSGAKGLIASPALYSHSSGADAAACYVRNVGTKPVVLDVQMFASSLVIAADFQNCNGGALPAGQTCVVLVAALPTQNLAFSCVASVTEGSSKSLRGTMELRDTTPSGLKVLIAEELR